MNNTIIEANGTPIKASSPPSSDLYANKTGTTHQFSRSLAREHGIPAAILLGYLANRIEWAQSKHCDGRGFYSSVQELAKHYPYLTPDIIKYTLAKLREKGVLKAVRCNRRAYDKTLCYTFANSELKKLALADPARFNVEIGTLFGVEAALILGNIRYWIAENHKKDNAFTWLRLSANQLGKNLPIPTRTINRILKQLSEGETKVLDRKQCDGFDQAFLYKVSDSLKLDASDSNMQTPDSTFDEPNRSFQTPESPLHTPNSTFHPPEPPTNTYYKNSCEKAVERESLKKHIQTGPAAPGGCVCVSNTLPAVANTNEVNLPSAENVADDSTVSFSASNSNAGLFAPSDLTARSFSPSGTESPANGAFRPDDALTNPLPDQKNDASLPAQVKAQLFMAGVRSLNGDGYGIVYSGSIIDKGRRFFELNPDKPTRALLAVLETCITNRHYLKPEVEGEYD
jgi:hypothetical protein